MTFFRASTFLAAGPASERRRSKLSVLHCGGETDECCLVRVSDLAVGGKQRCNCFGMLELHLPWLELTIITPLIGALLICRLSDPEVARKRALIVTGLTLFLALGAWEDFSTLHTFEAHDHWDVISPVLGDDAVVIDELSAPLLPLAALLYFLMTLSTLRTKVRRFPFAWTLVSLTLVLAMLSCRSHWGVIGLLPAQAIPPAIELRSRGRSTRVFLIHMALFRSSTCRPRWLPRFTGKTLAACWGSSDDSPGCHSRSLQWNQPGPCLGSDYSPAGDLHLSSPSGTEDAANTLPGRTSRGRRRVAVTLDRRGRPERGAKY